MNQKHIINWRFIQNVTLLIRGRWKDEMEEFMHNLNEDQDGLEIKFLRRYPWDEFENDLQKCLREVNVNRWY